MSFTEQEIKEFIKDWGQTTEELQDALLEFDPEWVVDVEGIMTIGNYFWCEKYQVWITENNGEDGISEYLRYLE